MMPMTHISTNHQYEVRKREALTIICVNAGNCAPKFLNTSSNCGTTKINRIADTRIATANTIAG